MKHTTPLSRLADLLKINIARMNRSNAQNAVCEAAENTINDLRRELAALKKSKGLTSDQVEYPVDIFYQLIAENSPYAFYLFQWVPYQTDAQQWRVKMLHDVKAFDGREEHGIWPNGSFCGSIPDKEVEFIRISRQQISCEWVDPRNPPEIPDSSNSAALTDESQKDCPGCRYTLGSDRKCYNPYCSDPYEGAKEAEHG